MKKLYFLSIISFFFLADCKKSPTTPKVTAYTITATPTDHGSITPSYKSIVPVSESRAYTITPDPGYSIASLIIDGIVIAPSGTYIFNSVDANHTISATFSQLFTVSAAATDTTGTVTPTSLQVNTGEAVGFTFNPKPTYHVDTIWVDGVFARALGGNNYAMQNITKNHTIRVSFTDFLSQKLLDSLKTLLIGQWTMTSFQARLAKNVKDDYFQWDAQTIYPCAADSYDQFFSGGIYEQVLVGLSCSPLKDAQFKINSPNHWVLKKNGKAIYITDPSLDSLTNIKITKDSLIAYYYAGYVNSGHIKYRYHYARKK
jgi:hypothetical protein